MSMTDPKLWFKLTLAVLLGAGCWSRCCAFELENSYFDNDSHRLRYGYASAVLTAGTPSEAFQTNSAEPDELATVGKGAKSPLKAFVLSAAVPGLGQYYYGSKLKAGLFFGAEVAAWTMHVKWHGDGVDQEDEFQQYNDEHWSEASYDQYIYWAYDGATDDEQVIATEVTHHLPDTKTQQYYEMTGKYDQFSWGWDDATRDGEDLATYGSTHTGTELAITGPSKTPNSARRLIYEGMRDKSNRSFDKASKMIIAAIANRVVSAFEAYFVTKRHNEKAGKSADNEFGQRDDGGEFHFRASLKSLHSRRDTPYVKVTYKF